MDNQECCCGYKVAKFLMDKEKTKKFALIRGGAPVTETLNLVQFLAWCSAIKRESVKTPQYVVNRWTSGSLTQRPKSSFAVSWPKQLGKYNKITKIKGHLGALEDGFKGLVLPLLNSSSLRVTRRKDLVAIFCKVHFLFSFQPFFSSLFNCHIPFKPNFESF